ncbi:MAG: hypothetical protein KAH93_03125 [Candidatus Aenigmarchaeota archaeon]|nr:hypothetical protein [Candidatus Aenigmarchaeota archaeon]
MAMDTENRANIISVAVIVVFAVAIILFLTFKSSGTAVCGDGECEATENCYDCPKDCRCSGGEYCSGTEKMCVASECGNGVCESFENSDTCCEDCLCNQDLEFCNKDTHKCELPDTGMTDETLKLLIKQYFNSEGKSVDKVENIREDVYEGQVVKSLEVTLAGEDKVHLVFVNPDGKVIDVPVY